LTRTGALSVLMTSERHSIPSQWRRRLMDAPARVSSERMTNPGAFTKAAVPVPVEYIPVPAASRNARRVIWFEESRFIFVSKPWAHPEVPPSQWSMNGMYPSFQCLNRLPERMTEGRYCPPHGWLGRDPRRVRRCNNPDTGRAGWRDIQVRGLCRRSASALPNRRPSEPEEKGSVCCRS